MSEVKDMYRFAKYIHSEGYVNDVVERAAKSEKEAMGLAQEHFQKKRRLRKISKRTAGHIMLNTLKHKYIEVNHNSTGYWLDVTSGRGMQLIAKTWGMRKGLKEQTMKEYPRTQSMYKVKFVAILGATSTILGAIIGSIVTYILTRR